MTISTRDIRQLVQEPSAAVRASIAAKVSQGFNSASFTENETRIAIDIFRLLLRDTAKQVRRAMAEELKESRHVPTDIIRALAQDVPEVASPVLEYSEILDESDLLALVHVAAQVEKCTSIARRRQLSPRLSHALLETRMAPVARTLLDNPSATIAESDLERALTLYRGEQSVIEALVCRGDLSAAFAERLFHLAAEGLQKQLARRGLPFGLLEKTAETARELGVLRFLVPHMTRYEIERLVDRMHRHKRLHYSLVLRALCVGEVRFFEIALAALAGIPLTNARALLQDQGPLGFASLYEASHMPAGFCDAAKLIYRTALEETAEGARPHDFSRRMIDRLSANGYHASVENMPYFLSIMRKQAQGGHVVH